MMVVCWVGNVSGGMSPDTLAGDLGRGLPAQFRVRPDRVVIVPPSIEHEPGMGQRSGRHPSFLLIQDRNDQLFVEPTSLHIDRLLASDSTKERSHFRGTRQLDSMRPMEFCAT